jgi:beta-glucanase (GH16 family)
MPMSYRACELRCAFVANSLIAATLLAAPLLGSAATAQVVAPPPAGWTPVANEGGAFTISGTTQVRYGANSSWLERTVSGAAQCSNAFFGRDPLVGVGKQCWAAPLTMTAPSPPPSWKKIASEGGSFTLSPAQPVRYGFGSSWIERTVDGTGSCTNQFFGRDPLAGTAKECWVAGPANDFHPAGYMLLFSDEFSGTQLDRTHWCTRYVYGGGPRLQIADAACQFNGDGTLDFLNDEQQRYVDTNRSGEIMHVVSGGVLTLRATKTRVGDTAAAYEAAMIRSKQTYQPDATNSYYLTARVKLPDALGTWPAFWLSGDRKNNGAVDWPPEIDIFEGALNGKDDRAEMLRQGSQTRGGQQTSSGGQVITFAALDFDRRFDNYIAARSLRGLWIEVGLEWTAQGVCYFVDGYKTMCESYRWVSNAGAATANAAVLLNLAIGGSWAGRYGIEDAKFPTSLDVDYVRVYRKQ